MKVYTDLNQSKRLAEILPLESADMFYRDNGIDVKLMWEHNAQKVTNPCWSLAALLEIIKKLVGYSLQSLDTHTVFMNCELGDKPYNIETENYDNPLDACYDMIIKLYELNLL